MNLMNQLSPVLLAAILLLPIATAETGSWTLAVLDEFGKPVGPDGLEPATNFTVQVGVPTTTADGARYLLITSSKTNATAPLYRKNLGFFGSTYNGTHLINVTLNLKTFEQDLNPNGDYLHIWIERTGGSIEAEAPNVIIKANFAQLLQQQQTLFFGYMQQVQRDFTNQIFYLNQGVQQLTNYVIVLALLVVFVGLFSARDILRKSGKAAKQSEASRSAFDAWLKAYVAERLEADAGSRAQQTVDKEAEKQETAKKGKKNGS